MEIEAGLKRREGVKQAGSALIVITIIRTRRTGSAWASNALQPDLGKVRDCSAGRAPSTSFLIFAHLLGHLGSSRQKG